MSKKQRQRSNHLNLWLEQKLLTSFKERLWSRCLTGEENQNLKVEFSKKQGVQNFNLPQKGIKLVFFHSFHVSLPLQLNKGQSNSELCLELKRLTSGDMETNSG